jgi:hypothetical protein
MGNRRGQAIFAAALIAHAALFALLAFALRPPPAPPAAPEVAVTPVYLARLEPPDPQRSRKAQAAPLPALSRPAEAPSAPSPVVTTPEPGLVAAAPADGMDQRVAQALRGGRAGCSTPSLLSEAERLKCQDRLEAGSKLAKYIPTPLPAERRAYYDRIVKAKGDMKKMAVVDEHGPGVACKLAFGGPKGTNGWKKHPHGLKLGPLPCYVVPSMGPLSVEADMTNPDTVIRDPKKAAER